MNLTRHCIDSSAVFCISLTPSSRSQGTVATVESSYSGWAAVAFGTNSMGGNVPAFIGWAASLSAPGNYSIVISKRPVVSAKMPLFGEAVTGVSPPDLGGIFNATTGTNSVNFNIRFSWEMDSSLAASLFRDQQIPCIFAVSNTPASNPQSAASDFPFHDDKGSFILSIGEHQGVASTANSTGDTRIDPILLHGLSMFIAWAVLPTISIFIARYLKMVLGDKWFSLHKWIMIAGVGGFSVAALIALNINEDHLNAHGEGSKSFVGQFHEFFGASIVYVGLPCQIILGFLINHWFVESRISIPWWDIVHWWLGRGIVCLALINIFLGLQFAYAPSWISWSYACWIFGTALASWWYGERKFGGAVDHVAQNKLIATTLSESFEYDELMNGEGYELNEINQ